MAVRRDAAQLSTLLDRVAAGEIRINVADRHPLADLPAIHAQADQGTLHGKTVITL
ncbi:hypothetical protein GCM10027073_36430 [Streptomyces chlorus]